MKKLVALTVLMLISLSTFAMEWQGDIRHKSEYNMHHLTPEQQEEEKLFALFKQIEKDPKITIRTIKNKKVAKKLTKYRRQKMEKLLGQK